jgi:hypothetical protein
MKLFFIGGQNLTSSKSTRITKILRIFAQTPPGYQKTGDKTLV